MATASWPWARTTVRSPKSAVPAVRRPGVLAVEAVSFPKLRTGGELVELKLTVPSRPRGDAARER